MSCTQQSREIGAQPEKYCYHLSMILCERSTKKIKVKYKLCFKTRKFTKYTHTHFRARINSIVLVEDGVGKVEARSLQEKEWVSDKKKNNQQHKKTGKKKNEKWNPILYFTRAIHMCMTFCLPCVCARAGYQLPHTHTQNKFKMQYNECFPFDIWPY